MKKYKWNYKKLLKNIKIFLLGTCIFWLPLVGCYIANFTINFIENIIK